MSKFELELVGSLVGHNGIVESIVIGKDSNGKPLVVSGGRDRRIIVWNLNLENPKPIEGKEGQFTVGAPYKSLTGHSHFVSSLALSSDSKHLVSGSWDKTARLWDLNTFKTKTLLKGHTKDILSVSFSPDNRFIYTGSMDNTVKVWNAEGEEKFNLTEFGGWVSSIYYVKRSDKSNYLAIGSWDQKVRFFEPKTLNLEFVVEGFEYGVVNVQSDEEGDFLFSGEKNGKIRVHKLDGSNTEIKSTIDVNADLNSICFDSKYYSAVACATNKGLYINEVNKQSHVMFKLETSACHTLAWDESKTYLFAGFADGVIRVLKFKQE